MSDIPILPNPFKMLDLEREKKIKLTDDKCNSCNDERKKSFNNLKKDKPIVEGFELEKHEENGLFAGLLIFSCAVVFISSIKIEWITKEIIKALTLHTRDDDTYAWIPLVVGVIMFLLRFVKVTENVPALIGYFENTVGHFMFLIFNSGSGLNDWIRSDNFETLINNGDGKVTKNYNPLMSIFNLNNYEDIINQMRFENADDESNENVSDFFVTLEHENGKKTKEDFNNYIKKKVIMKRAYGEVTLLILTTLISTGILKSVYY